MYALALATYSDKLHLTIVLVLPVAGIAVLFVYLEYAQATIGGSAHNSLLMLPASQRQSTRLTGYTVLQRSVSYSQQ
jgi:hypothetical protein